LRHCQNPVLIPRMRKLRKCAHAESESWWIKYFEGSGSKNLSGYLLHLTRVTTDCCQKKEETSYCKIADREERIISPYMELPPLLKEFVMKETGRSDVKMKVVHKKKIYGNSRLASEGETPNVEVAMGVGKPHPTATSLYEGLNM